VTWHVTLLCLWPELQHPVQSANMYTLYTKNKFHTGSDMSVQVVSCYQPFVTSLCLSICRCFLPSTNQNYFCCLSFKQCLPNMKKNMKKIFVFLSHTAMFHTKMKMNNVLSLHVHHHSAEHQCWDREQLCHCKSWY